MATIAINGSPSGTTSAFSQWVSTNKELVIGEIFSTTLAFVVLIGSCISLFSGDPLIARVAIWTTFLSAVLLTMYLVYRACLAMATGSNIEEAF